MILLDSTGRKLQASIGAVTTTAPDYFTSYVDITTTTFLSGQSNGTLTTSATTDILAAPAGSTQRQVKHLSIFNRDTVSKTVTVIYNDAGSSRTLYRGVLAANEMLEYIDSEGWSVLDANGIRKFTSVAPVATPVKYMETLPLVTATALLQGSLFLQRITVGTGGFNPDVGLIALFISNSTNAGGTASINMGIYSYNVSRQILSMASSTLRTFGFNSTVAASSYTHLSGTKMWSIPTGTWSLTAGDYVFALGLSVTTSGTSGTWSHYVNRSVLSVNGTEFGGGTGNNFAPIQFGVFSAATNGLPASIPIAQVIQTGAQVAATPWFILARTS